MLTRCPRCAPIILLAVLLWEANKGHGRFFPLQVYVNLVTASPLTLFVSDYEKVLSAPVILVESSLQGPVRSGSVLSQGKTHY